MNLNRKKQPAFKQVEQINIIKPVEHKLPNNQQVYLINAGEQDICRIDFIFNAGEGHHPNVLLAPAVNSLMREGTSKHTAAEIAEKFDYYGAYVEYSTGKHTATITLYTLNKYLEPTTELIHEIIHEAVFPEKELKTWLQRTYQSYKVGLQKTKYLAQNKFTETLFPNHPYGTVINEESFKNIDQETIKKFYKQRYSGNSVIIVVSGLTDQKHINTIEKFFGKTKPNIISKDEISEVLPIEKQREVIQVNKSGTVQTSIRQGKITINKVHKDFPELKVANTILGGYFGSRLMKNIREDKGYTYGIGSHIATYIKSSAFMIYAETGKDVAAKAIIEVDKEIDIMQNKLVGVKELTVVKNYILGQLLRTFDGPFAIAEAFISLNAYGLDYEYFNRYVNTVKNISPETIRQTMQKYLKKETMLLVTAGDFEN